MLLNQLVSQYLIHSYLYYQCNINVISDHEFDAICQDILLHWDAIQAGDHPHKHLLNRSSMQAGTGFALRQCDYPSIVIGAATDLAIMHNKVVYNAKRKAWNAA